MLTRIPNTDFDQVYAILHDSFPTDEIRPKALQQALLDRGDYQIWGLYGEDDRDVKALIAIYDLETVTFLEHFAVKSACRNQGLGSVILGDLLAMGQKPVCLEVELPTTDIARRRIGFYERNGFHFNDYPYAQPPLAPGQDPVELRIMSSGRPLSTEEFEVVKGLLYTQVYHSTEN